MYNIRRKLIIITVFLFVSAIVWPKISLFHKAAPTLASENGQQTQSNGISTVFSEGGEKFVAHRGYSNYAPENSIPAFELAGKIGFWGIETDIAETTDGHFVCMHDETLDRTTTGEGTVTDYSLDDLNQFTIDFGNNLKTTENLKIPTLEEYLSICKQYECVPVVEIKSIRGYDTLLNKIIESGLESRCIITGEIGDITEIRSRNSVIPVMTIGYTPASYTDNLTNIAQISDNRGILYNYPQVHQEEINILHQQNIYCGVWSVDETATAQEYINYGADFIVTNEIPARLNHMINEHE